MNKSSGSKRLWLAPAISFLHAILLVGVTILLVNTAFIHPSSFDIAKYNERAKALINTYLLKNDTTSLPYQFAFIDVAWSKTLVPKYDSLGIPIGKNAITDRKSLSELFQLINNSEIKPKFILCDIFFGDTSRYDSLLQREFDQVDNLIIPINKNKDQIEKPVVSSNFGMATITEHRGSFLKYQYIVDDTLRQLPLLMFEKVKGTKFRKRTVLLQSESGQYFFNNFIPTLRLASFDLNRQNGDVLHLYIDELLAMQDFATTFLCDRIVIIGDFENLDRHQTIWGDMSGALILVNAFLALQNQDNLITWPLLLLLMVCYTLITYYAVLPKPWLKGRVLVFRNKSTLFYRRTLAGFTKALRIRKKTSSEPIPKKKTKCRITLLIDYGIYILLLEIINLLVFFWFNIHLTPIFYLATWFWLIDTFAECLNERIGGLAPSE